MNCERFAVLLGCLVAIGCGASDDLDAPGDKDRFLVEYGSDAHRDAVPMPDGPPDTSPAMVPQVVFLSFGGETISACGSSYCSNAEKNESSLVKSHFGSDKINFGAWGTSNQRAAVQQKVSALLSPYGVQVVTSRPANPPYTMVVVTTQPGPAAGVSFLDCVNRNPNDIAYVYGLNGSSTVDRVVRLTAHELGHSFGLTHVSSNKDYMHYQGLGNDFTVTGRDPERSDANCLATNQQDAPAMLTESLAVYPYPCNQVDRVSGASRYHTAAAISKQAFPNGANEIVVASGANEAPDALPAGPLAYALGGPLLTTDAQALPEVIEKEIQRLGATKATIIGGTGVISQGVESTLAGLGLSVDRIAGGDRYDTARQVALALGPSSSKLAIVSSGEAGHLVDALAMSGPAAALGVPILLVTQSSIPSATQQALSALGIQQTIVLGGTGAISDGVLASLPNATRVSGADRHATAAAIAEEARLRGVSPADVFLSRSDVPVDALAAGALGRILLLTPTKQLGVAPRPFIHDHATTVTLLGGYGALNSGVNKSACYELK